MLGRVSMMDEGTLNTLATPWIERIAAAFAVSARPALTSDQQQAFRWLIGLWVRTAMYNGYPASNWPKLLNPHIEEWARLNGIAGPSLAQMDENAGTVIMQRPEGY
jgi:hypothetical protein